ncbi:Sphingosine-1-phosphate phosphatase 2 [Acipenser ruthenus]|uniref:Sphingosine-1-phosphate phosphatase 2 n=1 Tax=Acipenser ruthenus TaxID=7906 RepID=A0A662YWR1_ACIRT|nr:Sphingosine-1-phosphate phosphatase 2 [Acipenser ruthenus]
MNFFNDLQNSNLVASFQKCCGLFPENVAGNEYLCNDKGSGTESNGRVQEQNKNDVKTLKESTDGDLRHRSESSQNENSHGNYRNGINGIVDKKSSPKYVVKNRFLYCLFRFAAALGQEVFYITFLPCTYWNFDPYVCRRLVGMWAIVMYIGQVSKDLLKWPRPFSPPVVKLETRVDAEYGMPSTHAMAATSISFTFLLCTKHRYKYPFELGLVAAVVLSALVSLSRLYTGMHTVLDVICGVLITALVMAPTYPFWDVFDQLQLTSPYTPVFAVVVPFLMSYYYPRLDHYSPTRGDTTTILGVWAGCTFGFWINFQLGETYVPTGAMPFHLPPVTLAALLLACARFLVGIVVLVVTRHVVKSLSLQALGVWFEVSTKNTEVRHRLEIEVPYKFVTYSSIGIVATVPVPMIYSFLGLL